MLIGPILLAMIVLNLWLSCLSISFLACCSALCLFEKHMLAFVDFIHALPTRARNSTQFLLWGESCIQGEFLHQVGENLEKCICSGGACIHVFCSSLAPDFSCALLPMVSNPFALP
jgi:hypothetical protein